MNALEKSYQGAQEVKGYHSRTGLPRDRLHVPPVRRRSRMTTEISDVERESKPDHRAP